MRRLLTGGIKAILAIAALSTAAHWALRVQREPAPPAVTAAPPDPVVTGSITPRRADPVAETTAEGTRGLDQRALSELFATAGPSKLKVQKAIAKR